MSLLASPSVPEWEHYTECLHRILKLDPEAQGKRECIRSILETVIDYTTAESAQLLEIREHTQSSIRFIKYYPEESRPLDVTLRAGVNYLSVTQLRWFLITEVLKEKRIASGLSGSVSQDGPIREEVIPYVHLKPDLDERSVIFYPLVRGEQCIGTLKICNFTREERFGLAEVYLTKPIGDAIANLLHLFGIVDRLSRQTEEYDTLLAEATDTVEKLQIGERLSYQFLTATSHLHELAGLLSGMSSDRMEILAILQNLSIPAEDRSTIRKAISRYDRHRRSALRKLREIMAGRPSDHRSEKRPTNLKDLINDQLDIYDARFKRENIRIRKSLGFADYDLKVDPSSIRYVVRILLNNAIRAVCDGRHSQRRIEIRSSRGKKNLTIRFVDNGEGVPQDLQKPIFEAFFTTKEDGSGIGLYWAKRVVEQEHDGKLLLERSLPGVGSTFLLRLALEQIQQ